MPKSGSSFHGGVVPSSCKFGIALGTGAPGMSARSTLGTGGTWDLNVLSTGGLLMGIGR